MNKVLPVSVSAQCVQYYHYKTFEVYAPNNTLINVDFDYNYSKPRLNLIILIKYYYTPAIHHKCVTFHFDMEFTQQILQLSLESAHVL